MYNKNLQLVFLVVSIPQQLVIVIIISLKDEMKQEARKKRPTKDIGKMIISYIHLENLQKLCKYAYM